jgi:hypothetical protein
MFFTDYSMWPGARGQALEERRFESVWAPEHSHIPTSRTTPFPQRGELPKKYHAVTDPSPRPAAAESVPVTVWGVTEDLDRLWRYRDLGVARVVISLPSSGADEVLPILDRWAELMERMNRS